MCLLEETLPRIVIVPILFLKFEVPHIRISDFVTVQKLSDDFHLARGWHGSRTDLSNPLIESGATHALFISNGILENHNDMVRGQATWRPEHYPVEMIDTFFAVLRISTGHATGYAQLLTLPVGWASAYSAYLPELHGPSIKNYPPAFEHHGELDEVPTIGSSDADKIAQACRDLELALGTKQGPKLRVAMHRLNLSAMRASNEDGIIDAMIALEALLSDGTQEMTHKVAMRLAGLYKLVNPSRTEQVFKEVKRIYGFRSKIVHGVSNLDTSFQLDREGEKVAAVDAAAEHLRTAFAVVIKNPGLLDPTKIDSLLLTGTL
jgi:hypothetical protein